MFSIKENPTKIAKAIYMWSFSTLGATGEAREALPGGHLPGFPHGLGGPEIQFHLYKSHFFFIAQLFYLLVHKILFYGKIKLIYYIKI